MVQRVVGRARQAARSTAARLPRQDDRPLRSSDLDGIAPSALLLQPAQARAARRTARRLGLPRGGDGATTWSALGALAALMRIADDGRRKALVVDAGGSHSLFFDWARYAGFAPLTEEVLVAGDADPVAGLGSPDGDGSTARTKVDLVALVHPSSVPADEIDVTAVRAAAGLRRGGLLVTTVQIGPRDAGGLEVADLRALLARLGEQHLSLVGELPLEEFSRARATRDRYDNRPAGLALLTLRRR